MHAFEAIDFLELVTVTGGEDPGTSATAAPRCVPFTGDPTAHPPLGPDSSGTGARDPSRGL